MAKVLECTECSGHYVTFNKLMGVEPTECPDCAAPLLERAEFFSQAEWRLHQFEELGITPTPCESHDPYEQPEH